MPIASINSLPSAAPLVIPTGFFVSPTGSSSNPGTIGAPWSLAYALSGAGGAIVPNSTIWLRGGVYTQGPTFIMSTSGSVGGGIDDPTMKVKWRNFPGEFVSITTTDPGIEVIRIDGSYNWVWGTIGRNEGIEFWRNTLTRNDVRGTNIWFGFTPQTGNKLIHVVTHDGSNGVLNGGFNPDYDYGDLELYGCVAYNNGEESDVYPNFLVTHGFYIRHQGATTRLKLTKNILFNQIGYCLHIWSQHDGGLRNIDVDSNIVWGGGKLSTVTGTSVANILFAAAAGFDSPVDDCTCTNNMSLVIAQDTHNSAPFILGGLNDTRVNKKLVFTGNYIVGAGRDEVFGAVRVFKFQNVVGQSLTFANNTIIPWHDSLAVELRDSGTPTYDSWANNTYGSYSTALAFRQVSSNLDFADWKVATGLGSSDTVNPTNPVAPRVFAFPVNKYNANYGHVCFFNFPLQSTVAVDLSSILAVGNSYEVYNAQDIFGTPVLTGVYTGGTVAFPTTGRPPPVPIGPVPRAPVATNPFFDAFLVKKIS